MRDSTSRGPLVGLTSLLAAATLVVGCGSSSNTIASKTPEQILAASRTAAEHASSVQVAKRASQGGLTLTSKTLIGHGASRTSLSLLGVSYESVRIGDTVYERGNRRFYRRLLHGTGASVPTGTWIKVPTAEGDVALKRKSGLSVRDAVSPLLVSPGNLTKGAATTVAGKKAVALSSSDSRGTTTIYVAAAGEPYPLEIVRSGREKGKTVFSGWNQPVALVAPSHAVELKSLQGRTARP